MIDLTIINDFDDEIKLSIELVKEIISNVITHESKYRKICISIIIVDDEYLRNLKIKYFNMDIFTDIITFNLSDNDEDLDSEAYISWNRINENAKEYKQTINQELKRVIIHGCLHLVGFNDSEENEIKEMRKKEKEYLNKFTKDIIIC